MDNLLNSAMAQKDELINIRRYIHQNAETGMHLPLTFAYVKACLENMGYAVQKIGDSGLMAVAGGKKEGKTILLRADMDALPMKEESGLSFASENGRSHCCGHDMHTAMLLGAAKLLKEREHNISGRVKFLFQPGEEVGIGAQEMLQSGALETPVPDAVLALHVNAKAPAGRLDYGRECTFASNNDIDIEITGQGGHGARPHEAVDPIKVANQIYTALQTIRVSEIKPMDTLILTITSIHGGNSYNAIPDVVTMKGTMRAYDETVRATAINRIREISQSIAEMYHAKAEVRISTGIPSMYCSPGFTDELLEYAGRVQGKEKIAEAPEVKMGSEDFSFITEKYPNTSAYLFIGAGPDASTGFPYGQHSPKVVFNEEILPQGAAVMAACALSWLNHNS